MPSNDRHNGLVMVKPHAFDQVLTPVIADILDGGYASERLEPSDPLRSFIGRIETKSPVIRDLRTCRVGETLLKIFYDDKRERRYFPLIVERYMGMVAFLPYVFHGSEEELPQLYEAVKGSAETFDATGQMISLPRGVRGALSAPYLAVDDTALLLDDTAYKARCIPMIDNILHVCDTSQQNKRAFSHLEIEQDIGGHLPVALGYRNHTGG